MNREGLDRFCERGILALILAILIFTPLAMGGVDEWAFLVVQVLAIGVMLLWALRLWAGPKPQLLWPPICWVVLGFTLYAIARYLTADIEYVARHEMIQVLVCAFLFFAVVNNLYRQEVAQIVSFTMIFLGMAIAGYAIFQMATHSNHVWNLFSPYLGRASGTYISPNDLAGFLEMLLPLAAAYVLAGRLKVVARIFVGYAALVLAGGLVVTYSRGGWMAAAIGLAVLLGILIGHRNHRWRAILLAVILIAGGAVFASKYLTKTVSYRQRVEGTINSSGQVDLDLRRDMWSAAERMWLDHFWCGVGPAHFNYRFREYRPEHMQAQPDRVHNDYLNLLVDWGVTGGALVLAGMAVFGAGVVRTWRHVRRSEGDFSSGLSNRFAFFIGAISALFALAAHSFVDFNLHIPANAILGITLLGLLTSNLRFATESYWLNLRLPMKLVLTLVLASGAVYLGGQTWRLGHETYWLARAEAPGLLLLDRAAVLEKAFAAEPANSDTAYQIGEAHRLQSFVGGDDYQTEGETAIKWFDRAIKLNRFDAYSYLRTGMCLDWLERKAEAGKFYSAAEALDPNGYYMVANIGWHYVQTGDYAAAREWLERSLRFKWDGNVIGLTYLPMVEQKLGEKASRNSQN
jgi:O-antigen ligase